MYILAIATGLYSINIATSGMWLCRNAPDVSFVTMALLP